MLTLWIIVILLAAFALTGYLSVTNEKKRQQALTGIAQSIGLTLQPGSMDPPLAPKMTTASFAAHPNGSFRNLMTGSFSGLEVKIFDYAFTVGIRRNRTLVRQTVAVFPQAVLPDFEMRPAGSRDRLAHFGNRKDVRFDSNANFSHRYFVRSTDELRARQLFTPLLPTLEGLPVARKWHIEGDGSGLILYRDEEIVKPEEIRAFLEETSAIATAFLTATGLTRIA